MRRSDRTTEGPPLGLALDPNLDTRCKISFTHLTEHEY